LDRVGNNYDLDGLAIQQVPTQDFDVLFEAVKPPRTLIFVIRALFLFKEKQLNSNPQKCHSG
jgi:hypothetical protein